MRTPIETALLAVFAAVALVGTLVAGAQPVVAGTKADTSINVVSDANPSLSGQAVTFTATLTAAPVSEHIVTNYVGAGIFRPFGIAAGPDGALWFANMNGNTIGRITTSGAVTNPSYTGTGISGPYHIAAGPDGALWFTNYNSNSIGRITTAGVVTNYTGTGISRPTGITAGLDGALWFTNYTNNSIGRITTAGLVTSYTGTGINYPYGITAGPDGALWFTNLTGSSIGRITTAGAVTNFSDPGISSPVEIAGGPDGALWFTNRGTNSIGRITTTGVVTRFTDPSINSPFAIAAGPDGALWFTNYGNNSIGRVTTAGVVTNYTGTGITIPQGIAAGPDGGVWFTNHSGSSIGRVSAAVIPTGTVQFKDDGNNLSSPVALDATGRASTPVISDLPVGSHTITATYIGDVNFNSATSAPLTQRVLAPNGKILFTSFRDGNAEIYKMGADGSGQTRLTNNTASDNNATWSPDGTSLAFDTKRDGAEEIYVMKADGTALTRLTNNSAADVDADWSSSGIVFTSYRDGGPAEIYKMNADGSGQTRLTNNSTYEDYPSWSPDGTKIVFESAPSGNLDIYVMNADGTGQTRLTTNAAADVEPSWSPDGTKILFTSNRDGNLEIYVMNADGSAQTRLTNNAANDDRPAWSPDGTKIVFDSDRTGNWEVFACIATAAACLTPSNLTNNPAADRQPSWGPATPDTPATATLTVIKHVINDNGGTAAASAWTMDVTATNPSSNHFAGSEGGTVVTLNANTPYSVTESGGPTGYSASSSTGCSSTTGLAPGTSVTCTLTNDDQAATLIVIKHVINDADGAKTAADFTLDSGGTNDSPDNFAGAEFPGTIVTLDAGVYSVSETDVAGYTASYSADCSGSIGIGQTKTCTVTNDDTDVLPDIAVTKTADPSSVAESGGNVTFTYTVTNNSTEPAKITVLSDDKFGALSGDVDCKVGTVLAASGDTGDSCAFEAIFAVPAGDFPGTHVNNVTATAEDNEGNTATDTNSATVTYTDVSTPLSIVKTTESAATLPEPGGDFDFKLVVTNNSTIDSVTVSDLDDTYLTDLQDNGACEDEDGDAIAPWTLSPGEALTCTFTVNHQGDYPASWTNSVAVAALDEDGVDLSASSNTQTVSLTDISATLIVIKHVINDNGGTALAGAWTMDVTATNPSSNHFAGSESPGTTISIDAGAYSVAESGGPAGYSARLSTGCAGTAVAGQSYTCTITNDDIAPTLALDKTVTNDNGGNALENDFVLRATPTSGPTITDAGGDVPATSAQANIAYTLSESGPTGYTGSAWVCTGTGVHQSGATVTLDEGATAVCAITNDDVALSLIQGVLAQLQNLPPTGNTHNDNKIAEAIDHLQKSLESSWWVTSGPLADGNHLDAKNGHKVFEEEKTAIHMLGEIKNPSPGLADQISSWIHSLVAIDRNLAQTAIDEVTSAGGDPEKLVQATSEMAKAARDLAKGNIDGAIDHYRNAWMKAQEALKKV